MYKYQPKRPVKSFQDLDVYQQTHNLAIKVAKHPQLAPTALEIPKLIATAHSIRFADQNQAIAHLEQAMLNCNLMVVYLDQYRDLKTQPIIEVEQISKDYLTVRRKIFNLQRSWQKFMGRPAADFALGLGMQRPAPHPYKANNKTTKNAK